MGEEGQENEEEEVDDGANVEQPSGVSVADRALQFTQEITDLASQDEEPFDSREGDDEVIVVDKGDAAPSPPTPSAEHDSSGELMAHFRALLSMPSADDHQQALK